MTSSRGGTRKRPRVFTEHGVLMAANVLRSSRLREVAANVAILNDVALRDVYRKLQPLLAPPPEPEKRRIGF